MLHADNPQLYGVENRETGRRATIAFDGLQHQIDVRGEGIHYVFEVTITQYGMPSFTMRECGRLVQGTVTHGKMLTCCARCD